MVRVTASVRTIQGKVDRTDPVLISLCSFVVQYRSSTEMRRVESNKSFIGQVYMSV